MPNTSALMVLFCVKIHYQHFDMSLKTLFNIVEAPIYKIFELWCLLYDDVQMDQ